MLPPICVDQAARGSGIGLALIKEMKARLQAQGIPLLAIIYAAFNDPTAALMHKARLQSFSIIAAGPT